MFVILFRGAKFKIEILKAKMIMKVAKIERSEKNYKIEYSVYIIIQTIYFIHFFSNFPIFATFLIILALKIFILNFAPLKRVTSNYFYCK